MGHLILSCRCHVVQLVVGSSEKPRGGRKKIVRDGKEHVREGQREQDLVSQAGPGWCLVGSGIPTDALRSGCQDDPRGS